MPIPIYRVHDTSNHKEGNFYIDYSMLIPSEPSAPKKKIVTASDKDADLLIKLWAKAEKVSDDVYNIKNSGINNNEVLRLKTRGFLTGGTEEIRFTGKARAVITTMVLGESNAFQKEQKKKSYTEIIASMSLKGKAGYRIPKIAANYGLIRVTNEKRI